MTFKEITDLIRWVNKYNLSEFKIKDGEFELTIRSEIYQKNKSDGAAALPSVIPVPSAPVSIPVETAAQTAAPATPATKAEEAPAVSEDTGNYIEIKSPMVGTFYRSSSPEKGPYVQVGDKISVGSVTCIIEAMKLFNEIESEVSGTIVKILVDDASPVEYDQPLFLIDPNG